MHTVERVGTESNTGWQVVFYNGVSYTCPRDGHVKAAQTIVEHDLTRDDAYRLCNYLNGGNGKLPKKDLP